MLHSFTPTHSLQPYEYGQGSMYRSFFGKDSLPTEDCFRVNTYVNNAQYMPGYIQPRDTRGYSVACHFTREDAENTTSKFEFRPTMMDISYINVSLLRKYLLREHFTFLGTPGFPYIDTNSLVERNLVVIGHTMSHPDNEWTLEGYTDVRHGRECCSGETSSAVLYIYINISDSDADEIIENIGRDYEGIVYENYYNVLDDEKREIMQVIEELKK